MAEGRGGVVKKFLDHTTPSARTNEASRLFLDRAATPPPAEEGTRLLQLSKHRGKFSYLTLQGCGSHPLFVSGSFL